MEAREGISSGVTVIGAEAPSAYHMAPRSEAPSQGPIPEAAAPAIGVSPVSVGLDGTSVKKKRGRPRKYGPDGSVTMALSPMPISSSAPFGNDFSISSGKRGKPRGMEYKMPKKVGVDHLGDSVGTNFMPHIITVNTGEVCLTGRGKTFVLASFGTHELLLYIKLSCIIPFESLEYIQYVERVAQVPVGG